jgi:hypothetical protein
LTGLAGNLLYFCTLDGAIGDGAPSAADTQQNGALAKSHGNKQNESHYHINPLQV